MAPATIVKRIFCVALGHSPVVEEYVYRLRRWKRNPLQSWALVRGRDGFRLRCRRCQKLLAP